MKRESAMLPCFCNELIEENSETWKFGQYNANEWDPNGGRGGANRVLRTPFLANAAWSFIHFRNTKSLPVHTPDFTRFLTFAIRVYAEFKKIDIDADFVLKKQTVSDLLHYVNMHYYKIKVLHPDILRNR